MTISSTTNKNTYAGDGVTTAFSFTFRVLDESHFTVEVKDVDNVITSKVLTTDYTVSGSGNDSGRTNYTSGNINFLVAPLATDTITIKRNVPLLQQTDYVENDTFPAESHEEALDELTMISQQLNEDGQRSLKLASDISGIDPTIPAISANQFIRLNAAGDGFEAVTLSSSSGLGAIVEDLSLVLSSGSNTPRDLSSRFSEVVNAKDLGVKGGNNATSTEFESAIRYCIDNGKALYLPADEYYLESDIDLSDTTGNIVIFSDSVSGGRTADQVPPAKIIFNNDGTDNTGRIGINMGPDTGTIILNNIFLSTLIADARSTSGDFIGIVADGRGAEVSNCRISGFNTAFKLYDIGYANWYRNYYQGNKVMLRHELSSWPYGTTFRDRCSQAVQNTTVYDVPSLWHSHWADGIYEYSDTVIKSIESGCTVSNCYFENNATASVYSPDDAADLLALNNYYNGSTDLPIISNNTTNHGFDRCGLLELDQNIATMRALRFVDRTGVAAGYLQASRTSEGQIQVIDKDYNIEGNVPAVEGAGQNTDRLIKSIVIHDGSVYGLPSGWTFTAVSAGVYEIVFDDNIRIPNIQVTPTTTSVNSANVATFQLTMTEASGGNWSIFRNASGFVVRAFLNGTASDSTVLNINIII